jgi:hypothetical protein
MRIAKVQDHPDLVRDMETNAVLNVNKKQIDDFNLKRQKILQEKMERENTQTRLNQMESDVQEIKDLLKELIRSQNAN